MSRKATLIISLIGVLLWLTQAVWGQCTWQLGDDHKMHFPQLPDGQGWAVNASMPFGLADDFMCMKSGPIRDIHFWGSWQHGIEVPINSFWIRIYADIPAAESPTGYSIPGDLLWEVMPQDFDIIPIDPGTLEGWYNPFEMWIFPDDHPLYYQYDICLAEPEWFYQDSGTIYWLAIAAETDPDPMINWGWKTSLDHWNDNAVYGLWDVPEYFELYDPFDPVQPLDLAFVIAAYEPPESCCLPDTTCANLAPSECISLGGVPQGTGTVCAEGAFKKACCFADGSCLELDTLCCLEMGGTVSIYSGCGGDGNNNGINDVCEPEWGACCLPDGSCELLYMDDCTAAGGAYQGAYRYCLGDNNLDETDDRCEAPWQPGDDHKMHFPQTPWPPDFLTAVGFLDPHPEAMLADDFMCMESGPITDIHFWAANFFGLPEFHDVWIRIFSDIPAEQSPTGYSMPGDTLWEYWVEYDKYNQAPIPVGPLHFYDPFAMLYEELLIPEIIQFDLYIPDSLQFIQDSGTIYWLSISNSPTTVGWGWVSTMLEHWNDDAVWTLSAQTDDWLELYEPPDFINSLDFAFVITGLEIPTEACCLPDTTCADLIPADCESLGGVPQGPGTECSLESYQRACCLPDNTCTVIDTLCCLDLGGSISSYSQCGGDLNENGINDVCEPPWGACCLPDGTCDLLYYTDCESAGGTYQGTYRMCLGDNNLNGVDDRCELPWEPGDPHKMHYPQWFADMGFLVGTEIPPEEFIIADDFECTETGPITDIHLWGGLREAPCIPEILDGAVLQILSDIPAAQSPTGYSMPGDTLWEFVIEYDKYNASMIPIMYGWYDPVMGVFEMPGGIPELCQYDIYIPDSVAFIQDSGTIYWLAITNVQPLWGWASTFEHWNDDAVFYHPMVVPEWMELREPPDFMQSLDLAFVITGVEDDVEACCFPDGGCQDITRAMCLYLGGIPQGQGTVCWGLQACCLSDGSCANVDSACCVNLLGGTPQGDGTACTDLAACCMPDGECTNLDPVCCIALGGIPSPGQLCSGTYAACCLADTCLTIDSACCAALGGTVSADFPWFCLGDNDGSGVDDACETPLKGACCLPDGSCVYVTPGECGILEGDYKGDATLCQGDNNYNGVDDACDRPWVEGDDHKMHMPQLPNPEGWDVAAVEAFPIADDWICSEIGWVKDIHFWGSWLDDIQDDIVGFWFRIYHSPGGEPTPMEPMWEYYTENFVETPIPNPMMEGWLEPGSMFFLEANHSSLIQYDVYIPEEWWFWQMPGETYWLSIYPVLAHGIGQWGWKSSFEFWNSGAVWTDIPVPPPGHPWHPLGTPPDFVVPLDLSFVITGGLDCDCIPGDANNDGQVNVGDAVYIISYVFKGGPPPIPYPICSGDANCDCQCNIGDGVYIISFVFKGGPPPCDCATWIMSCGPPLRK